jgi:hypothetical protein
MKQPCNAHAYEQEKKEQQKQFLIDMMEEAEKLGLYDIFNDEKRQGIKDLIDTHKQRLEKYSERFGNDKSEIGNPDTWGKRVVEEPKQTDENGKPITYWGGLAESKPIHEQIIDLSGGEERFKEIAGLKPKQETLEEASWKFNPLKKLDGEFLRHAFKEGAKWQAERSYSEEEVIKLLIYCKDRFGGSGLEDYTHDDEVKEWFEQFKNK